MLPVILGQQSGQLTPQEKWPALSRALGLFQAFNSIYLFVIACFCCCCCHDKIELDELILDFWALPMACESHHTPLFCRGSVVGFICHH